MFFMLVIVTIMVLLAYWINVEMINKREINKKLHFPSPNSGYPILGDVHIWSITKWSINEKFNHFIEVMRGYPTTIKVWFGSKVVILVNNPNDIKTILTSPHCMDKSSIYHKTISGDGLFVTNGNSWKNQRRHLNATFSPRVLNSYSNEFNLFGRNIVAALNEHAISGKEFDVTPLIGMHATNLITRTIYGNTQQTLETAKQCYELVSRLMNFWGERMLQIYFNLFLYLVQKIFRIQSQRKVWNNELRCILQPVVKQKVVEYQTKLKFHEIEGHGNTIPTKDEHFLEKLTRLRFEGLISITEYRHTSMTMFLAGADTTVRSISMIVLALALYPDYQRKIYEEVSNFIQIYGNDDIDINKLSELSLLDRFIKETFRLYNVVPLFGRKPSHDIKIKEGVIPAGTDVLISIANVHQNPDIWGENATKFNPDNFLPDAVANREQCSYLPFSYGPRNCIGYKFAQLTTYIAIFYLVQNYHFSTTLKTEDIKFKYGFTKYLINGNLVSVHSRNEKNI